MSSTTVQEAAWTDEDLAYALAWDDWRRGLCDGCGHPLRETTDPTRRGGYDVAAELVCDACAARTEHTEIEYAARDRKVPAGTKFFVDFDPARIQGR